MLLKIIVVHFTLVASIVLATFTCPGGVGTCEVCKEYADPATSQ